MHALDLQVQDISYYYPITVPANANVILLSVLLIIAGGLIVGIIICQISLCYLMKFTKDDDRCIIPCCCSECVRSY